MITPSFSLTATERVLPKLALDFTTGTLDNRVTFTRTTDATYKATYTNSSGYVTAATNNQPRFDYNPITLACKGLLIEESRTNVILYSENFADGVRWGFSRATPTANVATSPANDLTASSLIETAATTGAHNIQQAYTSSAAAYSFSVYVKAAGRSQVILCETVNDFGLGFDLTNGTTFNQNYVGTNVSTYSITNVGNGWYRCSITGTLTAALHSFRIVMCSSATAGGWNYTGDGTSGVYLWGAQLELGAFPTSYIPNLALGSTTRNADVAKMTGTNFSSWFNSTQGTLCVNADQSNAASSTRTMVSFSTGLTANSGIEITYANGSSRINFRYWDTVGGVAVGSINSSGFTPAADTFYKSAFGYQTNNFGAATNGTSFADDVSGTVAGSADTLNFGKYFSDANFLNGHIKYFAYYPQRLLDREIQAISKQG